MIALVLAQSAPAPISAEWQNGLLSFGIIILIAVNIWDRIRRKPAVDEVFDRKLIAVSEAAERRLSAECQEMDRKIEALDRRRETDERDMRQLINDQVSQMEKFISKQITDNRENNTEKFGGLFAKVESTQATIQALSNEVMNKIGRLEGQIGEVMKVSS